MDQRSLSVFVVTTRSQEDRLRIEFELFDEEGEHLNELAAERGMPVSELVQRWIRERLVHERERSAGGGRPMSPRAQRRQTFEEQ
jgi:hypothetical protein